MAQANVPSGRPAQNHVAHTNGVSRPTRSNSAYADGNVPFVFPQDGPRRHTYSQQTGDYEPPNKQHSRINHRPEILARKASLREKLDAAEKRRDVRLCKRTKVDLSDSADQSPWARKVVLCLGKYFARRKVNHNSADTRRWRWSERLFIAPHSKTLNGPC
jgi:hypothetical protein